MTTKLKGKQFAILILVLLLPYAIFGGVIKDDISKGAGARAAGMGGAFTAVADDYSAYFWNPAGLVLVDRMNVNVSYDSVFKGKEYDFGINYTHPLFDSMTVSATYFKGMYSSSKYSDDILYLTAAGYLEDSRTYALGANIKFINTGLSNGLASGRGSSLDIGVMVFPDFLEKKIKFGFLAQDLEAVIAWDNGVRQRVPLLFKMGASYAFDKTAVIDMDIDLLQANEGMNHSRAGVHIGGEKWFLSRAIGNFGFRAGFFWREALNPNHKFTAGISYGREDFVLDYVYMPGVNSLGDTHKLDISYFFGNRDKTGYRPPVIIEEEKKIIAVKPGELETVSEIYKNMDLIPSQKYLSTSKESRYKEAVFNLKNKPADPQGIEWVFDILDAAGNQVKQEKGASVLAQSFTWNGETSPGVTAKDGDYIAQLAVNINGKTAWRKAKVITVDATPPSFDVVLYPKVFAPVKTSRINELTMDIKTRASDIKSWTLTIRDAEGRALRKMSGDGYTGKLSWGGKDALDNAVKDGAYDAYISMEDYAGNVYAMAEAFTIDTAITKVGVKVANIIFKAGKESVVFSPSFNSPERVKYWDLEIYGKNNRVIKSYRNRPVTVKSLTWDGTDEKSVYVRAGSTYRYAITAYQKNEITSEKDGLVQSALPEFKDAGIELTLAAIDFDKNSKSLPVSEYGYLNQASEAVKKFAKDYFLFIKGYATDAGSPEENLKLSIERAEAVKDYLFTAQGVSEDNIYIIGYGDGEYADQAARDEIEKSGRRVEVELLTK